MPGLLTLGAILVALVLATEGRPGWALAVLLVAGCVAK